MFKLLTLYALAATCLNAQSGDPATPKMLSQSTTTVPLLPAAGLADYYHARMIQALTNLQLEQSLTVAQKQLLEAMNKQASEVKVKENYLRHVCTEAKGAFGGVDEGNLTCSSPTPPKDR